MIATLVLAAALTFPVEARCQLPDVTVIVTHQVPGGYTAAYAYHGWNRIWVEPAFADDAGVMYHELGHHVWWHCARNHPYWSVDGMDERFSDAWAEHTLGYDVAYYDVPWIDALWIDWWTQIRTFEWGEVIR